MNIDKIKRKLENNDKILEETGNHLYFSKATAIEIEELVSAYEKEKEIVDKINKLNIPVDTLIAEFERLEDLEDDKDILKKEIERLEQIVSTYNVFISEDFPSNELMIITSRKNFNKLSISEEFISKFKIKAKIEELEKLDFGTDLVSQFTANLTTITILQSLLGKE